VKNRLSGADLEKLDLYRFVISHDDNALLYMRTSSIIQSVIEDGSNHQIIRSLLESSIDQEKLHMFEAKFQFIYI
jgi:hypothetical protein